MKHLSTAVIVLALLVAPFSTHATVLRTGDTVLVADDQTIDGNFYGLGGNLTLSGVIDGDAHVSGGNVTINGAVNEDVFVVGGTTQIHSGVAEDVRIIGGDIKIAGDVGGDVFVIGGVLTILSTATVAGDVYFYGGEMVVAGEVSGSLRGTAEAVRVDTKVSGDVDMQVSRALTLGDRAEILGNVQYQSFHEYERAQGAVVVGSVTKNKPETTLETFDLQDTLIMFLIILFSALTALLLFRRQLPGVVEKSFASFGMAGLVGVAALLLLPMVSMILLASVLGSLVGGVMLLGYLVVLLAAMITVPIFVGAFIARFATGELRVNLLWVALGAVVVQVVLFIPILGFVLFFIALMVTLGSLLIALYRSLV